MYTLLLAEKQHIQQIQRYSSFLQPLLNRSDLALCEWRPGWDTLAECVPNLMQRIAGHNRWRVIILTDRVGQFQKNPFDRVRFRMPKQQAGEAPAAWRERIRSAKREAYDQAAAQPLTKLTTWLSDLPTIEGGINDLRDDPDYQDYLADNLYKQQLRRKILEGRPDTFRLPELICCVALRTFQEEVYDLRAAWKAHDAMDYADFWDTNLYPDANRYVVFDILGNRDQNYPFDYLRFLCTLLILAGQPIPQGGLEAWRLYSLNGECDREALRRLILHYDDKLAATAIRLTNKVREIETAPRNVLTDKEAETLFCTPVTVPVAIDHSYDRRSLLVDTKFPGLSKNCPQDEDSVWLNQVNPIPTRLHQILKQPRRALSRAAGDFRKLSIVSEASLRDITEFQLEDIREFIDISEQEMVRISVLEMESEAVFRQEIDHADRDVKDEIATRATRGRTLLCGGIALGSLVLGLVPTVLSALHNGDGIAVVLPVGLGLLGATGVVGVVRLIQLRHKLVKRLKAFNQVMHGLFGRVDGVLGSYSRYLTNACSVMRGSSILQQVEEGDVPEFRQVMLLKKHINDLNENRRELRELFAGLIPEGERQPSNMDDFYNYNFARKVDYTFPVPAADIRQRRVEFLARGNFVELPVDFIRCITLLREDLYE